MKAIVVSATSDIATEMCAHWKNKGWTLSGTYFSKGSNYTKLMGLMELFPCDLFSKDSIDEAAKLLRDSIKGWEIIVFASGSLIPVGFFDQVDIDEWSASIHLNFINQMRMLRQLLPYRDDQSDKKTVLFFAGGGTNSATTHYSAYTVSKIALIKMCEILDAEIPDVKFSIIGPGWVNTKIHDATMQAGKAFAGDNFEKTQEKLHSNECESIQRVIESFEWVISQPKNIVSGRNFSTVFDRWGTDELVQKLSLDQNMYKLRRCGNS